MLPSSRTVAVLLAALSVVLLSLGLHLFKLARRRFELFYADFTVGALLFAVIAAYTLGSAGSDPGFSDHMLLAGVRQQAFAVAGGFVFNLGTLGLLAGLSLGKRRSRKQMIALASAVLCFALAYPLLRGTLTGDIGLGPYAETLLISIGALLSTAVAMLYFVNIAIEGDPVPFRAYLHARFRQRLRGFAAGAMWAAGILCACLAIASGTI